MCTGRRSTHAIFSLGRSTHAIFIFGTFYMLYYFNGDPICSPQISISFFQNWHLVLFKGLIVVWPPSLVSVYDSVPECFLLQCSSQFVSGVHLWASICLMNLLSCTWDGLRPIVSLLYLYNLSFPWKTVAYLESGCNLFESDLKLTLRNTLHLTALPGYLPAWL